MLQLPNKQPPNPEPNAPPEIEDAGDIGEIEALRLEIRTLGREIGRAAYWGTLTLFGTVLLLITLNVFLWQEVSQQQAGLESARRIELLNLVFEPLDCSRTAQRTRLERELVEAEAALAAAASDSGMAYRARYELRVLRSRDPEICPPKAALRLREEALRTLAEIDGRRLSLRHAHLRRASLLSAFLPNADFSRSDLSGANLSDAHLRDAFLRQVKAVGAYFRGADLQEADLTGADLTGAYLTEANLGGADLTRAKLVDANLIRTRFQNASLKDADLRDADLGGADLSGARHLTQAQLDSAFGTHKTIIPAELERPGHWRTEKEVPPPADGPSA